MKTIAGFSGKTAAAKRKTAAAKLPREWGRYDISDAAISRYLKINDDPSLNVPLLIVRSLHDKTVADLAGQKARSAEALDLARAQGMIIAYQEMASVFTKVIDAGKARRAAGGFVAEGEQEE